MTDQFGTRTLEKLKAFLVCTPAVGTCGNGVTDLGAGEQCDDGNLVTESACPYGVSDCDVCDAGCQLVPATGPACGDGVTTSPPEVCDDGNVSCGSCNNACTGTQSAAATGFILAVSGASLVEGDAFYVNDGLGTVAGFEFDPAGNGSLSGNTTIFLNGTESPAQVAAKIAMAIGSSALTIDALAQSNMVILTHQFLTSLGNQAITVSAVDGDFLVAGMSGGAGGDCLLGSDCTLDGDCRPGSACVANTCMVP